MGPNVKAYEKVALVGIIDPQTVVNSEVFTGVVNLGAYHQALGICALGNMAAETVDFKCYTCDSGGGTAVALKSATQLAAHASNNDSKQLLINVTADELIASGAQYVKFGLVTGSSSGGPACVMALGIDPRFSPVTQKTTVLQTVS